MFKRKSTKAKPAKKTKAAKKPKQKKSRVSSDVVLQKPDTDVYTVMLVVAFLCIMTAVILLWMELARYGSYPWWKAG